jgi:hypothetical protein
MKLVESKVVMAVVVALWAIAAAFLIFQGKNK